MTETDKVLATIAYYAACRMSNMAFNLSQTADRVPSPEELERWCATMKEDQKAWDAGSATISELIKKL